MTGRNLMRVLKRYGPVTHITDESGNLRARFHGLQFNGINLILYVNALNNDTH